MNSVAEIKTAQLAADARMGYSLDQEFYTGKDVFDADMSAVIGQKWIMAGHVDQIKQKGEYFLFKIGQEQIIVIRDNQMTVRGFFNVCRHRGSLICSEASGRRNLLVCPYHAWSYALDGTLVSARLMPDDFVKEDNGLLACHVRVFFGLIFINLSPGEPVDFDLRQHGAGSRLSWLRGRQDRTPGFLPDLGKLEAGRGKLPRVLSLPAGPP